MHISCYGHQALHVQLCMQDNILGKAGASGHSVVSQELVDLSAHLEPTKHRLGKVQLLEELWTGQRGGGEVTNDWSNCTEHVLCGHGIISLCSLMGRSITGSHPDLRCSSFPDGPDHWHGYWPLMSVVYNRPPTVSWPTKWTTRRRYSTLKFALVVPGAGKIPFQNWKNTKL